MARGTTACPRLARGLAALAVALGAGACLTAPALFPQIGRLAEPRAGLERALVRLPDGTALRGVWLEAEPDAPVVLHLPGSAQSFSASAEPHDVLLESLADLGFSSLALDYRGIGGSEGRRDVRNLRSDAQAMWAAAVERAGGDPARVVIRGTSLGAVAAGELLAVGARPAALLLHAPVEGRSVVQLYARDQHGWWAALGARAYRPISRTVLSREIERSGVPTFAAVPAREAWLSAEEIEALGRSLAGNPRSRFVRPENDHMGYAFGNWFLSDEEEAYVRDLALARRHAFEPDELSLDEDLAQRLAGEPELEARARALAGRVRGTSLQRAALAATSCEDDQTAASWLRLARAVLPPDVPREAERAWFDLDDPAGPLPTRLVVGWGWLCLAAERQFPGCLPAASPVTLQQHLLIQPQPTLHLSGKTEGSTGTIRFEAKLESEQIASFLSPEGAEPHDVLRRKARLILKLAAVPDRVVLDDDGRWVAAGCWDGQWWRLSADGRSGGLLD